MLSIGELSKVTGLTVKTIRLYHEKGILPPSAVNEETGYRSYDAAATERARIIKDLRALDLSIAQIANILELHDDEADIVSFLEQHRDDIAAKLEKYGHIHRVIESMIVAEKEAAMSQDERLEIGERVLESMLIAGIRERGAYEDTGKRFAKLGRAVGRYACGKPLNLYYDCEHKEKNADFESCFPIRKSVEKEGIDVRTLEGGRCLVLTHRGPYENLGRSYERLFQHLRERDLEILTPTREVYLKGPGMIFKGNPKNYVTEIQALLA